MEYDPIDTGIGYHLRKANYYVSEKPRAGFRLHPAFYDASGNEIDYILDSAFEGSIWDADGGDGNGAYLMNDEQVMNTGTDKFCSIAGVKPASGLSQNLTRPNIEALAQNRGVEWHGDLIKPVSARQMLMIIELGMMNTQTGVELLGWAVIGIFDSIETAEIEDLSAIYLLEEDIDPETGIPIGNYLSQYSGNYYFSSFDHWIKEQKHVKYYFRYMDDIVIFGKTKEELIALKKEIDIYFRNELKLNIKGNWQVFPSYIRGVDFLGYRTFYKYTLLRKSTCLEMEKKMTAIRNKVEAGNMMNYSEWCSINSYKGWLKYADTFRLYQKYVVPLLPYADDYYIRNIKPNTKKGLNAA